MEDDLQHPPEEIPKLIHAIKNNLDLNKVDGIAFHQTDGFVITKQAKIINNLNKYRVAWELMKPYKYTYWGNKPAVVVQFSRGCPYKCNYCGQALFWKKWRYRNPKAFAEELAMLHKKFGVEVINFADENPTSNKEIWKKFLEALIEENVPVRLVGSCRADNIVRDAGILHLYKKAGFERLLLGIESYNENVLKMIKKGASKSKDMEAIKLLRQHNILSMATYVMGFSDETLKTYYNSMKQLLYYDPDQIQIMYLTPHKWTPFFNLIKNRKVIQADQRLWDYKHQVLETSNLKPWQVIISVKIIEAILQLRPKALKRLFFHKDKNIREAIKWYYKVGRNVWFREVYHFIFKEKRNTKQIYLKDFWTDESKQCIKSYNIKNIESYNDYQEKRKQYNNVI